MSNLVVDIEFVGEASVYLDGFSDKGNYTWNSRCPVCGDSERDVTKRRLYLYRREDTILVHCHNCGFSGRLRKLLEHLSPELADRYITKTFTERYGTSRKKRAGSSGLSSPKPYFSHKERSNDNLILEGVPRIFDLEEGHPARLYIESRKMPKWAMEEIYWAEHFGEFVQRYTDKYKKMKNYSEGRIILPYFSQTGKPIGFTGRSIETSEPTLRYIHIHFDDRVPFIYGLWKLDYKHPIYIVEGQFDSFFLPNCVAISGSSTDTSFLDVYNPTYVYDNEPRNREIVSIMRKSINRGRKVCIWNGSDAKVSGKDINDMIKSGLTSDQIKSIIDMNSYKGAEALLNLNFWKKV